MKRLLTAALALSVLATAGAASAQPGRNDHGPQMQQHGNDNRGNDNRGHDNNNGGYERRADKRFKTSAYRGPKGYHGQRFHRGERLAPAYRGSAYQVDYRRYNLAPPPRGYQYVRVNNDVVLTAIATGVITSVLMDMFN
jgi:Ni/Co efflux regulator RcnB